MTISERLTGLIASVLAPTSRLTGSMPSFHTRVSSAPITVSTAPPARAPSRCVRPDGFRPACVAFLSRRSLRRDTRTPPLAQVRLGELAEEDGHELEQRAQAAPEGGELAREVARPDAQHARRHDLGARLARLLDVAAQHAREQRG